MHNTNPVSLWNDSAVKLKHWVSADNYFEQFVKKLRIKPEWTVLDVGCGPGDISMWAARRVRHVTALDHADKMLDLLKEDSAKENLSNISCIQGIWDNELAAEIDAHDVVIASRSIGTMNNKKVALSRIVRCARQYAYITIGCKVKTPVTQSIDRIIGKKPDRSPGFLFAYNHLYRLGIRANVEFMHGRNWFVDLNDAFERCCWRSGELTPLQKRNVLEILDRTMVKSKDGTLSFPYNDLCWALIWWQNQGTDSYIRRKDHRPKI